MGKGDDIHERLINLAVIKMALCRKLPPTQEGRHVRSQLLRSGTSSAANYAEVRGAESNDDFIHKLGVVLKELNETATWLEIARRSKLLTFDETFGISEECRQLCRIMTASITTVKRRRRSV